MLSDTKKDALHTLRLSRLYALDAPLVISVIVVVPKLGRALQVDHMPTGEHGCGAQSRL